MYNAFGFGYDAFAEWPGAGSDVLRAHIHLVGLNFVANVASPSLFGRCIACSSPYYMPRAYFFLPQNALSNAKLSLADMDLIEINEAFAPQFLACQKELGFDINKANLCGGAIALGHPLATSGRYSLDISRTLVALKKRRRTAQCLFNVCAPLENPIRCYVF